MRSNTFLLVFWSNIIWLNIKRLKKMWFWRVLLILINAGMLVLASRSSSLNEWWTIIWVFLLMEMVVINLKNHLESRSTVILLRSLGASRVFLVLNTLFEIILPFLLGFLLAILGEFFIKQWKFFFLSSLAGFGIILIASPISTLFLIHQQEKYLKEL